MATQVITANKSKSWKDWFNTRDSALIINKKAQEKLFKIFDSSITVDKCKNEIEGHDETVFLFRQQFGTDRVGIFHHMKAIGGNIYVEKEEFGFIQGIEELATCIMTPDYEILTQVPEAIGVSVPTPTHLLSVSNIADVEALNIGQTTSYKPRNFIPIPPFLLETISNSISKSEGDSKQVLVDVVKEIKAFDTLHTNDNDYADKAKSKCKDILSWLYLVGIDIVQATPTMGCNSRSIIDHFTLLEKELLNNQGANEDRNDISSRLEDILKRPLEMLATSASSTQDFMHKLTQIQAQNSDKSTRSFKKIAPKYFFQ